MATQDLAIQGEGGQTQGTYIGGVADYTNLNSDDGNTTRLDLTASGGGSYYHCYDMQDFSASYSSISGVTVTCDWMQTPYNTEQIRLYVRIGGVNYYGSYKNGETPYVYQIDTGNTFGGLTNVNPATGLAWTASDINNAEWGVQGVNGSGHTVSVTYLKITVDYTLGIGFHTAAAQTRYKASTFSTFTFPDPAGSGFTSDTASYAMLAGWGGAPIPSLLYQLLASDGIKLSDAAVAQSLISLLASDGLKLSDAATVYKFLSLLASDGVKLSDSSVAQLIAQAAVIDGAKFSDSATVGLLFNLLTSDGIKLSDSAVIIKVISEIVADGVKFSDSAAAGLIFQVLASDGIKLSDSAILELLAIILLIRKLQKRTLTAKLYQRDFILKLPDRSLVTKKEE